MHYQSEEYLSELTNTLNVYHPNYLPDNAKEKLVKNVARVYGTSIHGKQNDEPNLGIYDLQLRALTVIKEIGNSQLLGCNEVVIPHLVNEYGVLRRLLGIITVEHKALNQFQNIKPHLPTFKLKDVNNALYNDLTQLSEEYDIDCNVKELVAGMPTDKDKL